MIEAAQARRAHLADHLAELDGRSGPDAERRRSKAKGS
jgi:hypothetical protein